MKKKIALVITIAVCIVSVSAKCLSVQGDTE